ncbi:MAG: ABC transporter substrate-binding protein [Spirochaetaceae bacterium]|jgi:ABC-type Fe3+ transport system substrate-binding protein|nr:ABC transporter substrate-binding protein [Spirochaetaceae bacterium]
METAIQGLNLLALMPCSVKVRLERKLASNIRSIARKHGVSLSYRILSNAVMRDECAGSFETAEDPEDLPDIIVAPGFSPFFCRPFVERFRNRGCFSSVFAGDRSPAFREQGLADPDAYYDILAFNPLVFLVDKTREPDLPSPRRWEDLLSPRYEGRIAYRGRDDRDFCEGVLLTVFRCAGEEGIAALGRTVKCRLHPAEMVKLAGSGREDAPCISVIPYAFGRLALRNKRNPVELVWPDDGAAVNPLVMTVKRGCGPAVREMAEMLTGKDMGVILREGGMYAVRPAEGTEAGGEDETGLPPGKPYQFVGWDFLKNHDIGALLPRLNGIMYRTVHRADPRPSGSGGAGA